MKIRFRVRKLVHLALFLNLQSEHRLVPGGGTGVSGLTRGLALHQGGYRSLQWSKTDGRPEEDPLAVHCFCVCSVSVLLEDLLGVSRSSNRVGMTFLLDVPKKLPPKEYIDNI